MEQLAIFNNMARRPFPRRYSNVLTVSINRKGVMDVDTVKGCSVGMATYPKGGCYGECYAYKNARTYGFDFRTSVSRQFMGREHKGTLIKMMLTYPVGWYRIGTAGDPSHDWTHTVAIVNALWHVHKVPVIITKHWLPMEDWHVEKLRRLGAVVNTSASGMDSGAEVAYRVGQINRLKESGVRSVCRVVTCNYGSSEWARACKEKQDYLLSLAPVIDNPLRARKENSRVVAGDVILARRGESVGGGKYVSVNSSDAYLGTCRDCPDQCGVDSSAISNMEKENKNEGRTSRTLPFEN
jgi:hypothetical protein